MGTSESPGMLERSHQNHLTDMGLIVQVETSKVYLRDTTVISPYALLLFGGAINVQHQVFFLVSNFQFLTVF
jgi:hypothetical protein